MCGVPYGTVDVDRLLAIAHAGRDRRRAPRGGRARKGSERARVAALREVSDVPERLLAPRGAVGHLHVQAGGPRRGRARQRDRRGHRRGHRRRAHGAARHPRRQRPGHGHPRAAALQARARPPRQRRARRGGALDQPRMPTCSSGSRTRWRGTSGSSRASCCSISRPAPRCSAWTCRSGPEAARWSG